MWSFGKKTLVFVCASLVLPASIALPAGQPPASMVLGGLTSQPIGHYEFCQRYADECKKTGPDHAPPRVTQYGWSVIAAINSKVNHEITPMTDLELYGKEEWWEYPTTAGDCEDYVLLKRRDLMEKGFSANDLLITVVRKPDGEGHAVLTIRTSGGDYILDNLNDDVRHWYDTPYTYLKRQASDDPGRWVSIHNGQDVFVSAVQ